jgi:hypothetical protein
MHGHMNIRIIHGVFYGEFSEEENLMTFLSNSCNISFIYGHPKAAYLYFFFFSSICPLHVWMDK